MSVDETTFGTISGLPLTGRSSSQGADDTALPAPVLAKIAGYSRRLSFRLNGEFHQVDNPDPSLLLSDFLHDSGLTGTKVGCGQGGVAACTVMLSRRGPEGDDHRPINACLRSLVAVAGYHVTTVEGIGNFQEGLDPVQHRIALSNGTQCGFCTPAS